MYAYIHTYIYISLSLSLSLCIYIYLTEKYITCSVLCGSYSVAKRWGGLRGGEFFGIAAVQQKLGPARPKVVPRLHEREIYGGTSPQDLPLWALISLSPYHLIPLSLYSLTPLIPYFPIPLSFCHFIDVDQLITRPTNHITMLAGKVVNGRVRLLTIAMAVSARSYCYGCGNENGRYTHLRIHAYMS